MKRDALRELGITDEQLDEIMRMNGEDINAANAKTKSLQSQLDEAKGLIDQFNQKQQQQLTQEEQIKALQDQLAKQQRDMAVKENAIDARAILKGIGLPDDAVNLQLERIVSEDPEATKANAQALADLITAQREEAEAATRKSLLKQTPHPAGAGSDGDKTVSKEDFKSMSYTERLQLFNDSPETYKELSN